MSVANYKTNGEVRKTKPKICLISLYSFFEQSKKLITEKSSTKMKKSLQCAKASSMFSVDDYELYKGFKLLKIRCNELLNSFDFLSCLFNQVNQSA